MNDPQMLIVPTLHSISPHLNREPANGRRKFRKAEFITSFFAEFARTRPDAIFCGHINFASLCLQASRIMGIPYTVMMYGIDVERMYGARKTALGRSAFIITISESTRQAISAALPEYKNEIFILPCTVDTELFKPGARPINLINKFSINEDDPVLLTVARLAANEKYKGYDRVIESVEILRTETPNIRYVLVGSGTDEKRIRNLIREKNLERNVLLAGYVSQQELADYYRLCDLFIMPSLNEGFGIVYLEALASGKPVVASRSGGSAEALRHGELGLLVEPDNVCAISESIRALLNKTAAQRFFDPAFLRKSVIDHFGYPVFLGSLSGIVSRFNGQFA